MSAKFTSRFAIQSSIALGSLLIAGVTMAQSTCSYPSGSLSSPGSGYAMGGYSGSYGASTAAEGYLNGSAAVINALGNFEVNDGEAAILREHARALDRKNNLKQTAGLQAQKKMWTNARDAARKAAQARAAEGQDLLSQRRATVYRGAYQLSPAELDRTTGAVSWPVALQMARFHNDRVRIEELVRQYVAYGSKDASTATEITRSVDMLSRTLVRDIATMPREDYVAAQKFLLGLKYSTAST
jgi:hypothetical protein